MTTDSESKDIENLRDFPVLPLRDVVVYPHMAVPLFVGREKSILALNHAMSGDLQVVLVAQKSANVDDPGVDDIYAFGTLATVLQLLKLPDGTRKLLVEGTHRAKVSEFREENGMYIARMSVLESSPASSDRELNALMRSVLHVFEHYAKLHKNSFPELLSSLASMDDAGRFADTIAANLSVKLEEKQKLLEIVDVRARLQHLLNLVNSEIEMLKLEKNIRGRVKSQMEKSQREYYLNEQMKAIQKELHEMEDGHSEADQFEEKIKEAGMPAETLEKAMSELGKLKLMQPMSAEATVVRNYLDWLVKMPWKKVTKVSHDILKAKQILNDDHYGLDKVKERILECLAVQRRSRKVRGSILLLVGPPGVGKTSLGRSIARATNRKFLRMSLGGVRDEAEIRGHRRTYIGSMPGKVVQSMSRVGYRNPLFLLDEIDKMSMDFRGDPASALLEVLDPEQNNSFNDHYLEVDYDLSKVMFVATANSLRGVPLPLLDRMEVIRISGYTEEEKLNIARRYLIPKQIEVNGLRKGELDIRDAALVDVIRYYTREAGVRNLEREIATVCRKVVTQILIKSQGKAKSDLQKNAKRRVISPKQLEKTLGVRRYHFGLAEEENRVGQVTGLAWTEMGGDLLTVEAVVMPGKGKASFTGQLGSVMKESIEAAMTVVRSRSDMLGIADGFYKENDFHIHVPEGAIPKDGPSAGVAMCTALVSVLTQVPVHSTVAMTGEITLRGEILMIGGLKEKLLAALRGGICKVLIPHENARELREFPKNIINKLEIVPVRWVDEVLHHALTHDPTVHRVKPTFSKSPSQKELDKTADGKRIIGAH